MSPVLTLDVGGPNEMNIPCEGGGHDKPRTVGNKGTSASGSEWSQIRGEFMVVPFVSAPLPWDTIATIRSLFALGAHVNCAGDVFNKPGTIICSAKLTDDLHETADRGTLSGTLFEVGSITGYTPAVSYFLLTSVTSPDDATALVSTPDGTYPGDTSSGMTLGTSLVPPTASCPAQPGIVQSSLPEAKHLSVPLNSGTAFGTPYLRFETGTVDSAYWDTSSVMATLSLVRSGSVVAGPWSSTWAPMGVLTSYTAVIPFSTAISLALMTGDRFLIEWYARIGLACGHADNGQRPFVYTGAVPGPRQNPVLIIGGAITSFP